MFKLATIPYLVDNFIRLTTASLMEDGCLGHPWASTASPKIEYRPHDKSPQPSHEPPTPDSRHQIEGRILKWEEKNIYIDEWCYLFFFWGTKKCKPTHFPRFNDSISFPTSSRCLLDPLETADIWLLSHLTNYLELFVVNFLKFHLTAFKSDKVVSGTSLIHPMTNVWLAYLYLSIETNQSMFEVG